jgi:hypothetical protein
VAPDPPPSAGEGGERSEPGEGNHGSEFGSADVQGARWISVAFPSPAPHPRGTLPRRGGRVRVSYQAVVGASRAAPSRQRAKPKVRIAASSSRPATKYRPLLDEPVYWVDSPTV